MFLRRRLKICYLFFFFYLQSRFLAPFFEGEGGVTLYYLPLIRTRYKQGNDTCLIINNQPFKCGCHGCDLVRVDLVVAVMAIQCGLVAAGALGILILIIIARSRLFTW
jgi:hypothetical protein